MPFLYKARQFAIENISGSLDQKMIRSQRGIFDDDYLLELEKEKMDQKEDDDSKDNSGRLSKKLHSLFFPFNW